MKQYPITRRNNTDKRTVEALKEILAQCEEYGCRPALHPTTDFGREIITMNHMLNSRRNKGQPIPAEITELYKKILQYPTFAQHNRRVETKQKEINQANWKAKTEMFKADFPNIELVFVIFGEDVFRDVINANQNRTMTKFLAEYLDHIVNSAINPKSREYEILMMYIGNGADAQRPDKKMIFRSDELPFSPSGIHPGIIAEKYGLTNTRIIQILRKKLYKLRRNINKDVFQYYIAGNTQAMLNAMPERLHALFIYQQKRRIADLKTQDLNSVGQWLMKNFDPKTL